jgi:uncharacterized protein YkwD
MPALLLRTVFAALAAWLAHGASAREPDPAEVARLMIDRTNEFRRSQGLTSTTAQRQLNDAARGFAAYMARTDRYGHEADGRQPAQRVREQGYDYCMVAENIAYHFSSAGFSSAELARAFVQGWKNSPQHRRNMLEPDATDIGLAVVRAPRSGRYYAVQLFGRPQSLSVQFRIANRSSDPVAYELDGRPHQLPPHTTDTHQQCSAPRLVVRLPGDREATVVQPADGERYAIERAAGRYRLRKS